MEYRLIIGKEIQIQYKNWFGIWCNRTSKIGWINMNIEKPKYSDEVDIITKDNKIQYGVMGLKTGNVTMYQNPIRFDNEIVAELEEDINWWRTSDNIIVKDVISNHINFGGYMSINDKVNGNIKITI